MKLTKEMLERYTYAHNEIERLSRKIDRFSKKVVPSEHGVVKGSMRDYPYAEKHFVISGSDVKSDANYQKELKQLIINLREKQKEYEALDIEVGNAIEEIENPEVRQIVEYKYVYRMTDAEIAETLGVERSTITKKLLKIKEFA